MFIKLIIYYFRLDNIKIFDLFKANIFYKQILYKFILAQFYI